MAETIEKIAAIPRISEIFTENQPLISGGISDFVNNARQPAIEAFQKMGIPGFRNENYKYTDLTRLFENERFRRSFEPDEFEVSLSDIFSCDVPEFDTHLILVVNGWYDDSNSRNKPYPEGVIIKSFKSATLENPDLVEKYYGKSAFAQSDPLTALNTA